MAWSDDFRFGTDRRTEGLAGILSTLAHDGRVIDNGRYDPRVADLHRGLRIAWPGSDGGEFAGFTGNRDRAVQQSLQSRGRFQSGILNWPASQLPMGPRFGWHRLRERFAFDSGGNDGHWCNGPVGSRKGGVPPWKPPTCFRSVVELGKGNHHPYSRTSGQRRSGFTGNNDCIGKWL